MNAVIKGWDDKVCNVTWFIELLHRSKHWKWMGILSMMHTGYKLVGNIQHINLAKFDAVLTGINLAPQWKVTMLHLVTDSACTHCWITETLIGKGCAIVPWTMCFKVCSAVMYKLVSHKIMAIHWHNSHPGMRCTMYCVKLIVLSTSRGGQ